MTDKKQESALPENESLRTRIAKVLFARNAGLGWDMKPRTWDGTDEDVRADWLADADAVIRALDLAIPCTTTGCRMRQIARRAAEASGGLADSGEAK